MRTFVALSVPDDDDVLCATRPPIVPPSSAVTAETRTRTVQLGGSRRAEARAGGSAGGDHQSPESVICPLCADSSLGWSRTEGGRHRRRPGNAEQARTRLHRG